MLFRFFLGRCGYWYSSILMQEDDGCLPWCVLAAAMTMELIPCPSPASRMHAHHLASRDSRTATRDNSRGTAVAIRLQ